MSNNSENIAERKLAIEREAAVIAANKAALKEAKRLAAEKLGVAIGSLPLGELSKIYADNPSLNYDTYVWPPRGKEADPHIPIRIMWTNGSLEYDVYLDSRQDLSDEEVYELRDLLNEPEIDDISWGVIDRGDGRINLLPPLQVPRHEHVAEVVIRMFTEGSAS